jgi:hypothetical protein
MHMTKHRMNAESTWILLLRGHAISGTVSGSHASPASRRTVNMAFKASSHCKRPFTTFSMENVVKGNGERHPRLHMCRLHPMWLSSKLSVIPSHTWLAQGQPGSTVPGNCTCLRRSLCLCCGSTVCMLPDLMEHAQMSVVRQACQLHADDFLSMSLPMARGTLYNIVRPPGPSTRQASPYHTAIGA